MADYLPFVIVGLTTGSVYALAAMGLVLTYTTSGVFNFAHGAVGMMATYIYYSLTHDAGMPTGFAVAICVLIVGPAFGVLIDRVLLRRLSGATPATYVVASLGLLVALQGIAIVIYTAQRREIEAIFPRDTYRLPGVNVGYDQTIVVLAAAVVGLGLAAFFRRSHLGLRMRAVVEAPDLTELSGVGATRITTFSWMMGSSFAALAGILLAPFVGLDAVLLTLLVIQAFAAAAIGRLTSLPLAYAGALLVGVGAAISSKIAAANQSLVGLPTSLPFIVLFAVLVFSRKGSFREVTAEQRLAALRTGRTGPGVGRRTFPVRSLAVVTAAAAAVPAFFEGSELVTAATAAVFVLIFASLGLLVGTARQVSLCHVVFVAFGITTISHLLSAGVPWLPALLLSGLIVVPVGAIVAIPAIRLSGLFVALATFGFGILATDLLFPTGAGFGRDAVVSVPRPWGFEGDVGFYYFALAVVVAGVVVVELVRVTRLGRLLRALADSQTAVESMGVRPTVSRVLLFCLSAFLAAVAGGLLGAITVANSTAGFDFSHSLIWLTVLVTAGSATLGGSLLAALLYVALPAAFDQTWVVEWRPIFFGVSAILLAQAGNGLVGLFGRPDFSALAERNRWRLARSRSAERLTTARAGTRVSPGVAGGVSG